MYARHKLSHRPPPREEGTNNKKAKVANGQNKNNLYSEKQSAPAHLTFLPKINFCPFYSWVNVSKSTGSQGGGAGVGGLLVFTETGPDPLLHFFCPPIGQPEKKFPVQSPMFTQGSRSLRRDLTSRKWRRYRPISLRWRGPSLKKKKSK